jgi:hypothetical protein
VLVVGTFSSMKSRVDAFGLPRTGVPTEPLVTIIKKSHTRHGNVIKKQVESRLGGMELCRERQVRVLVGPVCEV